MEFKPVKNAGKHNPGQLNVTLGPDLSRELREAAAREEMSMSELSRQMIIHYLKELRDSTSETQ